jgi:hypothetical protein
MPTLNQIVTYNSSYTPSNATTPITNLWSINPSNAGTISPNNTASSVSVQWTRTGTHTLQLTSTNCGATRSFSNQVVVTGVTPGYNKCNNILGWNSSTRVCNGNNTTIGVSVNNNNNEAIEFSINGGTYQPANVGNNGYSYSANSTGNLVYFDARIIGCTNILSGSVTSCDPVSTPTVTPISTPITSPVTTPVTTPVSTPTVTPVSTPVSTPVTPVAPAFRAIQLAPPTTSSSSDACGITSGSTKYIGYTSTISTGLVIYNDNTLTTRTYSTNPGNWSMLFDTTGANGINGNKRYAVQFDGSGNVSNVVDCATITPVATPVTTPVATPVSTPVTPTPVTINGYQYNVTVCSSGGTSTIVASASNLVIGNVYSTSTVNGEIRECYTITSSATGVSTSGATFNLISSCGNTQRCTTL